MAAKAINLNEKLPPEEELEIPSKTLDLSPSAADEPLKEAQEDSVSAAPEDDTQKKIRRAERFGMPVQFSEAEKRTSRAERFGTASGTNKTEDLSKSEELKRKARAERFGTSTPSTDGSGEEAKKKARLARFASASAKPDPEEEDKRKARALRFSNPSANTTSQVDGKESIVGKTTS